MVGQYKSAKQSYLNPRHGQDTRLFKYVMDDNAALLGATATFVRGELNNIAKKEFAQWARTSYMAARDQMEYETENSRTFSRDFVGGMRERVKELAEDPARIVNDPFYAVAGLLESYSQYVTDHGLLSGTAKFLVATFGQLAQEITNNPGKFLGRAVVDWAVNKGIQFTGSAAVVRIRRAAVTSAPTNSHHIVSRYGNAGRGWQRNWTQEAQGILDRAGVGVESGANRVNLLNHQGPHPELYHQRVYERLRDAARGRSGQSLTDAVRQELQRIADDLLADPTGLTGVGL